MSDFSEDMLRIAACAYGEIILKARAREIEDNKRKISIRKEYHKLRIIRVAICTLAVVLTAGVVLAVDVSAREHFVGWIQTLFGNRVEYRFQGTPPAQYDPLFSADFSLSGPDSVVCVTDTDARKEYSITVGSNFFNLIYMLSEEYDFSAEIGSDYEESEVWINGLEGRFYKSLSDNKSDIMIWHDAYDIVYILESTAKQDLILMFAENIRLDYYLDYAVCYNGAISHADFSGLKDEYIINCVVDEKLNQVFTIDSTRNNKEVSGMFDYIFASNNMSAVVGWGDSDVHIIQVKVNGFDGDYYDDPKNDYDILTWLDQDSGILYSIQMNCDVNEMIRVAESIRYIK